AARPLLATVLTVEALDTSGGVHNTLAARPKRVRRRRDVHFDHVVFHTIDLARLLARAGRFGDDFIVTVNEHDGMVFWMDFGFHSEPLGSAHAMRARGGR